MAHGQRLDERVQERLVVPTSWWVMGAVAVLALFVAYDVSVGTGTAVVAAGLLAVAVVVWLGAQSRLSVSVDADGLRVGDARLPLEAIGTVEALDEAAARWARGPGADPRAFFVLRGYVGTAVRVWVDDPDDPVPYWLLSSRRPRRLAAAAAAARDTARSAP